MLSVLFMESDDAMRHLLNFYVPDAGRVLDCTYGTGTLSRALDTRHCTIYGTDLLPMPQAVGPHQLCRADFGFLPFPDNTFDVVIFDPPYLYGRERKLFQQTSSLWGERQSRLPTSSDFAVLCQRAAQECVRVAPVLIAKVMNSRLKGAYVNNRFMLENACIAAGWVLADEVVYVRLGVGVFRNHRSAQTAHGYYLIFRRGCP